MAGYLSHISTRSQKYLELSILKFSSPFPVFLVFLTFADKDLKLNLKKNIKRCLLDCRKSMITQKHAEADSGRKQIEDDRCGTGGTIQLRASGRYSSETLETKLSW